MTTRKQRRPALTAPLRSAIESALNAALAGEGFDGGDFTGQNRDHFERALEWVRSRAEAPRRRPRQQAADYDQQQDQAPHDEPSPGFGWDGENGTYQY